MMILVLRVTGYQINLIIKLQSFSFNFAGRRYNEGCFVLGSRFQRSRHQQRRVQQSDQSNLQRVLQKSKLPRKQVAERQHASKNFL